MLYLDDYSTDVDQNQSKKKPLMTPVGFEPTRIAPAEFVT